MAGKIHLYLLQSHFLIHVCSDSQLYHARRLTFRLTLRLSGRLVLRLTSLERLPPAEALCRCFIYIQYFVCQNLRRLILFKVYRSLYGHNPVRRADPGAALVNIRKNNNLAGSVHVFQVYESHHLAALCNESLFACNHTADYAAHSVAENCIFTASGVFFGMGYIVAADS